jgi:hypothetical protein
MRGRLDGPRIGGVAGRREVAGDKAVRGPFAVIGRAGKVVAAPKALGSEGRIATWGVLEHAIADFATGERSRSTFYEFARIKFSLRGALLLRAQ